MKPNMLFQEKQRELARRKKLLKKKVFILKLKIFFLLILPVVIVLLAAKTLQTFLRIRLRNSAAPAPLSGDFGADRDKGPVIKPVSQTFSKPEFVTPAPVSGESL